ncbi:hypothetical protein [Polaromonas sp. CG9_12]|nr:hypothetical protein [Polaromonas sp. CG9_12]
MGRIHEQEAWRPWAQSVKFALWRGRFQVETEFLVIIQRLRRASRSLLSLRT